MSDKQKGSTPILQQVVNDLKKNERESTKKVVANEIKDYIKALEALDAIESSIVEKLEKAGEDPTTVSEILKSLSD